MTIVLNSFNNQCTSLYNKVIMIIIPFSSSGLNSPGRKLASRITGRLRIDAFRSQLVLFSLCFVIFETVK
jgi:hypothetical protein